MAIENISDTARWVAVYRAMETARPDAIFRDPFADRLAGRRGREILDEMPKLDTAYERRKMYDTTQPGRGNQGHTFGDDLTEEQRWAVIEYLKTL